MDDLPKADKDPSAILSAVHLDCSARLIKTDHLHQIEQLHAIESTGESLGL
jgi:hypothetical protein